MKVYERIKMIKCMEFISRQINDEVIFEKWLMTGVPDGDIAYGDVWPHPGDEDKLDYLTSDEDFKDLMECFLRCMIAAGKRGGLFCDEVLTGRLYK